MQVSTINLENSSISELIAEFPAFLSHFISQGKTFEFDQVIAALDKLMSVPYTQIKHDRDEAEKERTAMAKKIVQRYFKSELSKKFPTISKEILSLKRYVNIGFGDVQANPVVLGEQRHKPEESKAKGELSAWLQTPLVLRHTRGSNSSVELTRFKHPKSRANHQPFTLKADFPGDLDADCLQSSYEGLAVIFGALNKLYLSRYAAIVDNCRGDNWNRNDVAKPAIEAWWIPVKEALYIQRVPPPPQDPALVLAYLGDYFLVGTWDVPEAQPLDTLLAEFLN